jgi:RNase P protein component
MLEPLQARPPLDVVIRAFPSAYDRDFDALRTELLQALKRLI